MIGNVADDPLSSLMGLSSGKRVLAVYISVMACIAYTTKRRMLLLLPLPVIITITISMTTITMMISLNT